MMSSVSSSCGTSEFMSCSVVMPLRRHSSAPSSVRTRSLRLAAPAEISGLRMQRPDVEGHVLEQAFGEHVVGMVVGIDESGNDELAARFDHLRFVRNRGAPHDFLLQLAVLVGRGHRDDARASDQDVAHRRDRRCRRRDHRRGRRESGAGGPDCRVAVIGSRRHLLRPANSAGNREHGHWRRNSRRRTI